MRARDQSSIFSTGGKFRPDYGLLLELHALTLVARSYALLMEPMQPPLDPPLILQSQHTDNPQNICESSLSIATLKYICNDFFIHVLRVVSVLWL